MRVQKTFNILGDNDEIIAQVEDEQTARLFAAAPEMKAQLEMAQREIECALDRGDLMTNCVRDTACRRIASIRAVLAQSDESE